MAAPDWKALATALQSILSLETPPLAIAFSAAAPAGVPAYDAPLPDPTLDGRTGRASTGCVFWIKAADRTFTTVPEDHGNCSVGSLTRGLRTLDEIADNADVAALLECSWVTMEAVPQIPVVSQRPNFIAYGPLQETPLDPDVVLQRLDPKQPMMLHDAWPTMRLEGKPQCHLVAIAKKHQEVATSVGCMPSRVRTGMSNQHLTRAIPDSRLQEVVERLQTTSQADLAVAAYAAEDGRRFMS